MLDRSAPSIPVNILSIHSELEMQVGVIRAILIDEMV